MSKSILKFVALLLFTCFLAACGSKKAVAPPSKAAMAAEVLANLKSKQLFRFINEWTGAPYKLGGMDKKGIDCSGFALILEKQIYGLTLPRRSIDQSAAVREKPLRKLQEGDLLFFSFGGNEVDHVGVYLNNSFFVHASTNRGVVVDDLRLPAYQKTLVKTGSLK